MLKRRVSALEAAADETMLRRLAGRLAAGCDLDVEELIAGGRRLFAYVRQLQRRGLSPDAFNAEVNAWIAADLGVDVGELRAGREPVRASG